MHPRAAELIRARSLLPHPEGGYFAERFRSAHAVTPGDGRATRPALTAIDFLLPAGQHSRWHVVASDELWAFQEGDALELLVVDPTTLVITRLRLGCSGDDESPWHVVRAGLWQAARPLGAFTLCVCAVGPGFDYADFHLLAADTLAAARLRGALPEAAALL